MRYLADEVQNWNTRPGNLIKKGQMRHARIRQCHRSYTQDSSTSRTRWVPCGSCPLQDIRITNSDSIPGSTRRYTYLG